MRKYGYKKNDKSLAEELSGPCGFISSPKYLNAPSGSLSELFRKQHLPSLAASVVEANHLLSIPPRLNPKA